MSSRHEGFLSVFAAILVLFTAMIDPWISVAIAVTTLFALAITRFLKPVASSAEHAQSSK